MILEILRRKYATLRRSLPTSLSWALLLSLLVGIPSQVALSSTANAAACSPTTTTNGDYTVVTFSAVGTCDWTVPTTSSDLLLEVLMVGGGGGAGFGSNGGGGGAGQVLVTKAPIAVSSGSSISVKVGAGGAGGYQSSSLWTNGTNGETSTITIASNSYNAIGGGSGGGDVRRTGASGGSGGGGALNNTSGSAITNNYSAFYSYGFSSTQGSGTSAGGAGAGGANSNRTGGTGVILWGLSIGGGGAGWASGTGATAFGGGSAGSGTGAGASHGNPGTDGTGGGGGGGEKGGSGLVVIRYKTSGATCSPTQSSVDTYTVLTFSSASICNWTVPTGVTSVEALVVGGGGSGSKGIASYYWPAGGGGGAVVTNSNVSTTPGQQLLVNVGAGGTGPGVSGIAGFEDANDGNYSSFGMVIAGGGKTPNNTLTNNAGATGGVSGNGNAGGFGGTNGSYGCGSANCGAGGGGGAGGAGNVLAGGAGVSSSISGSSVLYGAGGAGHNGSSGTAPSGAATQSVDAAVNRGGGGAYGKAGGSGVVIIRYGLAAGNSYLTFNANGGTGSKLAAIATNDSPMTLPNETGFSYTGFDFNGWNTEANGSGTSYATGSSISISTNTTLYAQWIRIPSPTCTAGVGKGGPVTSTISATKAGNGCVAISYRVSGITTTTTFNYTGADQSWTVPSGVSSATFFLIGAGGGGNYAYGGGGGGFATGTYAVTAGQILKVIVGQGGGGAVVGAVAGYTGSYTPLTYGGGGRGGSYSSGWNSTYYSSGGGRSAVRLPSATTDLATAGGGGGAAYSQCGYGGGGTTGNGGTRGGSQTAGGTGASSGNGYPGTNGVAYLGGDSKDEGGGGGGGFRGGGGGGDNTAGGGGSSYIALLTNGTTTSGGDCGAAASTPGINFVVTYDSNTATSGSVPGRSTVAMTGATLTLATNSGTLAKTNYTFGGWNTAANGSGTTYAGGATTYAPAADSTLYAQWNSTITYNVNGGTGTASPTSTTAKGTAANTTLAAQGTLNKPGSSFSGWNTSADGTGTNYAAGFTTFASPGNITLYAQWTTPTGAPTLAAGSDLGSSSTDKITSDNTPTINVGSVVSGARVVITATSATGTTYTCVVETATVSSSCTFGTMADGTYSFTVQQTYNGATSSASVALANVVIDATAPTVVLTSTQIVSGGNALATQSSPGMSYTITVTFSEAVSGFAIGDVAFDAASTAWAMTTTALTNATQSQFTFVVNNTTGTGNLPGKLLLRIPNAVASDVAGNSSVATATDFVINTIIRLTLTNEYQQSPILNPVVGGNNTFIAQSANGTGITLPGQGDLTRAGHTFAGWSTVTTNGSGPVLTSPYVPTVPIKLYSSWTPNVYVVSFNANGGNGAPDSATVNYTYGTAGLAASSTYNKGTLAKTGYVFAGWSVTAGGAAVATTYVPSGSIMLYARWTAGTYAITFDSNTATGGTSISNLSITSGTAKNLSTNTYSKTGYSFDGWNTSADRTGTPYLGGASVTFYGNVTLYAQWKVVAPGAPTVTSASAGNTTVTVTVAAASLSGTSGVVDSFTVLTYANNGSEITSKRCTVLASASPLSCTISGLTNNTIYKFKTIAYNQTGNTISTAFSSTATPSPFTVIYNINGGTSGAIANGSYNLGSPLTLPTPSRNSYNFAGWYDTTTAGSLVGVAGADYSPTLSTTTLYARWVGVSYTITYYGNGATSGTVPNSGSFTAGGGAYSVATNTGVLDRTGYTFNGWDTSTVGTGTAYATGASYSTAANLNLYAKWTPIARTVAYSGTTSSGSLPTGLTGKYIGETFTVASASAFSRSGFAFSGWFDGTNVYAAGSTYTISSADVTLTAQWTGLSFSTTYLANGGGGSVPTQGNLRNGETFTVAANSLTKNGFTFVAWNDGTNNYAPGASYTVGVANVSLIAQWTATGYQITYSGNGNTGGSAPATGNYSAVGAPYAIAANIFTKTGFLFTGWSDGSSLYTPGTGYTNTANLELSAQWTPKTIAISYDINGGSGGVPSPINWTYSAETPTALASGSGLTKTGYTFNGWATTASAGSGVSAASPSSSLTYYAVWTLTPYNLTYSPGQGTGTISQLVKNLGNTFTLASASGLTGPTSGGTFDFAYWNDGTSNYAAGATYLMPASDITMTAIWVQLFDVTYNANGGTTSNGHSQLANGSPLTIGSAAARAGYTFNKWIDQSLGQWNPGDTTTVTAGRYIFTASWIAISRSVSYDLNGGAGSAPAQLTGKILGEIVTLSTTSLTKAGYTFGGWSIGGTTYPAGATYTVGTSDVAPVAVWNAASFEVSYNANGATAGAAPAGGTFTTNGTYTVANKPAGLAKSGFTFIGWNTAANGNGTDFTEADIGLSTTTDLILYAKWSAAAYPVRYVLNGASSALPTQADVQFGSTFTVAAAATQSGKTFTGWSDGSNTYGGGSTYTMGARAETLTATWANQTFAITYELNGGTGVSAPTQVALIFTDTFTVQSTSATKAGYSFGGWSSGSNTYAANTTFNMTASNVTLTAIWNIAAPGIPGTPTAVAGDGNATISVVAPVNGGAPTSYVVTASPGGATCTVTSPATSCTITGLTNGTSYSFSSIAKNSTGNSSSSATASASPAGKPGVPTGVSATRGDGLATVSLTPPSNTGGPAITSYTITASPGGATCQVIPSATSCNVLGLANGTAYTFEAIANNGVVSSDSSTASAAVTPASNPGAPTITSASSSTSGTTVVNFSAPASTGGSAITGYTITSSPGGITCSAPANATSCAVSGLSDGVAYTFTAVATNAVGDSSPSSASSAVTSAGLPTSPSSVTATVADASSVISVSGANAKGSSIISYTVQAYDATGATLAGKTCTITAPGTSCTVTGLTNGSDYTFKATATNGVGTSAASASSAEVTPAGAPGKPTDIVVTPGTEKVTVEWTAPSANGSPILSYTVTSDPGGVTCTATAPNTSCDVTGLTAGTTYTFTVKAQSAAGLSAASDTSTSTSINSSPSTPLNVTGVKSNGAVVVSWDLPADFRGSALVNYTATAYTAGGVVAGTCTSPAGTESCSISGLTNGVPYTFKVSAANGIGTSAQSQPSSSVTPSTVPGAPSAVVASAGDARASVTFTAPASNGGSAILDYTVTASPGGATITGSASPLTVTGLDNETAYTFTVTARNTNGSSSASSASSVATPKESARPTPTGAAAPSGNPYVGSTLSSQVTFSGAPTPTLSYQWKVCDSEVVTTCTNILDATSSTFVPSTEHEEKFIVVSVTANNSAGSNSETSEPTQVIKPEVIFVAPNSGLAGTAGSSFVLSVAAAGGVGSFTYTVSSGSVPAGLVLDPATGQISGTPTTAGTYTFTVQATDSNGVSKDVVITLTIAAAIDTSVPNSSANSCDAACQAINAARSSANQAVTDAATKARADAVAKAAADKAAADQAAADAASKAQSAAATKAAADAAAAVNAAADAAAKATAADAAKKVADKAASDAAAAVRAAQIAASNNRAGTNAATTSAAAAKAAAEAQVAVKAAATAAAAAIAAKKQVDISLNVSVSAASRASDSAAAQKQANAVAAAAKAAAEAAAAKAAADAAQARNQAAIAARAAADAQAASVAEKAAAAKAALDAQVAAKAAALAASAKAAADLAAQKAAADLATALSEKAKQSAALASATDERAKSTAALALDAATKKVEALAVIADSANEFFEEKAQAVREKLAEAQAAVETAEDKSEAAEEAASNAASKVSAAKNATKNATNSTAAAQAAQAAAKALPTTVKIAPAPKVTSTDGNGTKAMITGLKPGQKIKVTVKIK